MVISSLNIRFHEIFNLFKHLIAFARQPLLQDLLLCATKSRSKFFGGISILLKRGVICSLNIAFNQIINLFKYLIAFARQTLLQDLACCATESSSKFFGGISILLKRERVISSLNIGFTQVINLFKHLIAFAKKPLLQDLVCCATKCSSKFFEGISILQKRERVIFSLNIRFYQIINLFKHIIAFEKHPLLQDLVCCATESSSKGFEAFQFFRSKK